MIAFNDLSQAGLLFAARGDAKGLYILFAVVSVIIVIFVTLYLLDKKRTEAFKKIAEELDLPFFETGDSGLQNRLEQFQLFTTGRRRKIKNLLQGEANDVELAIFDYRYTVGGGKNSRTYTQSVFSVNSSSLHLTPFALRPEGFFHKIGAAFGAQDIDFESHPEFSNTYLLRGGDEKAIRELFDDRVLSYFESKPKMCVEASGSRLICYRLGKKIRPDETQQFMGDGYEIFGHFSDDSEV